MKIDKFTLKVSILPLLALIIGIFVLGLGIYETVTSDTKGYKETVGYFNYSTIAEKSIMTHTKTQRLQLHII